MTAHPTKRQVRARCVFVVAAYLKLVLLGVAIGACWWVMHG